MIFYYASSLVSFRLCDKFLSVSSMNQLFFFVIDFICYHLAPPQVTHEFLCEIEHAKQNFLAQTAPDKTCCLFADATKIMNADERRCVRHGAACDTW